MAYRAEELLFQMAGDAAPNIGLGADSASRRNCRTTWDGWWKTNAGTADLARLTRAPALGLSLVSVLDGRPGGGGEVVALGRDGKVRWRIAVPERPADACLLPSGRDLIAEHDGKRVTERDRMGNIVWQYVTNDSTVSCERLPSGDTFIATYNHVMVVNRDGKRLATYPVRKGRIGGARRLRNGNILYAYDAGLVELGPDGKEAWSVDIAGMSGWWNAEPAPGGRYLVAQWGQSAVIEIDRAGKVHQRLSVNNPTGATRLSNGHTLVASGGGALVEFDRGGREVARWPVVGRPWQVRHS